MTGKLVIVSAPSGAGKTTIVHRLLGAGLGLEFSISACSRPRREHEADGKDYYFLSVEEFRSRIAGGDFVEWQEVYEEQYYGTLKSELDRIWSGGHHALFDVDVEGGLNLKRIFPHRSLAFFIMPPSIEVLEERLRGRTTDSEESIRKRMAKARLEIEKAPGFDHTVVNDNLEEAVTEVSDIVRKYLNV